MSKSYDLSTSTKWANLADGEHTVTIKSKASNYGTSNFSNSVTVTKGSSTYTLEAGTYKWVDNISGDYTITEPIIFVSNGIEMNEISLNFGGGADYMYYSDNLVYDSGWKLEAYETITLSTPQTVSAEFYEWAITGGNLVKQNTDLITITGAKNTYTTSILTADYPLPEVGDRIPQWTTYLRTKMHDNVPFEPYFGFNVYNSDNWTTNSASVDFSNITQDQLGNTVTISDYGYWQFCGWTSESRTINTTFDIVRDMELDHFLMLIQNYDKAIRFTDDTLNRETGEINIVLPNDVPVPFNFIFAVTTADYDTIWSIELGTDSYNTNCYFATKINKLNITGETYQQDTLTISNPNIITSGNPVCGVSFGSIETGETNIVGFLANNTSLQNQIIGTHMFGDYYEDLLVFIVTSPKDSFVLNAGTWLLAEKVSTPTEQTDVTLTNTKAYLMTANDTYGDLTSAEYIVISPQQETLNAFVAVHRANGDYCEGTISGTSTDWAYNTNDGDTYTPTDTTKLRTVIFEQDQLVDRAFFTWAAMQDNLVRQSGVSEHTLTWNASDFNLGITVKVNGVDVTSPYTLANGDKITLDSAHTIAVNGTSYTKVTNLNLSNVDIVVTLGSGPNRYNTSPAITINYTA